MLYLALFVWKELCRFVQGEKCTAFSQYMGFVGADKGISFASTTHSAAAV
jgi:hypothetical protein